MHQIRLRDPWEVSVVAGRTRHSRRFGRPRSLAPGERIWLVCASLPGPAEVLLNSTPLVSLLSTGPFAADVTDTLLARNEVVFAVDSDQPLGEVTLEVRDSP